MDAWAVIADDLTGASDTGITFARKGYLTRVMFEISDRSRDLGSADCIVIDTDSRALEGAHAYGRVRHTAEILKANSFINLYKKVDSTLRGNIGYELDALQDVFQKKCVFLAPAYPEKGRVTRNGIHYVHGVPASESEMAADPKTPVVHSEVIRILTGQTRRKCAGVTLYVIRQPFDQFHDYVREQMNRGVEIFAFDAESEEDLDRIGRLVEIYGTDCLLAGSAGLARAVVKRLPQKRMLFKEAGSAEHGSPKSLPVLIVSGSLSPVTRRQIVILKQQSGASMLELFPARWIGSGEARRLEIDRIRDWICRETRSGNDVCLYVSPYPEAVRSTREEAERSGMTDRDIADTIADTLGQAAAESVEAVPLGGLILTGGDTAKAVCRHLHADWLELMDEIEPGVPVGHLSDRPSLPIATKAGAFGSPEIFIRAIHYLKEGAVK